MLGRVTLLGSDGGELREALVQPKRLALLAFLAATQGEFRRRDTLLAMFWPDLDEARARHALKQATSYLRNVLGPADSVIVSRGADELTVSTSALWCDVT